MKCRSLLILANAISGICAQDYKYWWSGELNPLHELVDPHEVQKTAAEVNYI